MKINVNISEQTYESMSFGVELKYLMDIRHDGSNQSVLQC